MDDEEARLPSLEELPPDHRSGFVILMGRPNVGKSTLLNAWLGTKIVAVSPKPQTTRNQLLGILTRPDAQVIFIDTPGIHEPHTRLGDYMVEVAKRALSDADLVLFIVDASIPPTPDDQSAAQLLSRLRDVPVILALNKIDRVPPEELEARRTAYSALGTYQEVVTLSALNGAGRDEFLERVIALLPLGPRYYPEDQLTDQQERFIAAELIREQVMRLLEQEVPHAVAVLVQDFIERPNNVLYISATIYVEKDSQKGIVIGRQGAMLKRIGQQARVDLEGLFDQQVYLELWVKVRKNWRRNENYLRQLGYSSRRGH